MIIISKLSLFSERSDLSASGPSDLSPTIKPLQPLLSNRRNGECPSSKGVVERWNPEFTTPVSTAVASSTPTQDVAGREKIYKKDFAVIFGRSVKMLEDWIGNDTSGCGVTCESDSSGKGEERGLPAPRTPGWPWEAGSRKGPENPEVRYINHAGKRSISLLPISLDDVFGRK